MKTLITTKLLSQEDVVTLQDAGFETKFIASGPWISEESGKDLFEIYAVRCD